jgi:hypothetical protein
MTPSQLVNKLSDFTDSDTIQWNSMGYNQWEASGNGGIFKYSQKYQGDQRDSWTECTLSFRYGSSNESIKINESLGNVLKSAIEKQERRGKDKATSKQMDVAAEALAAIVKVKPQDDIRYERSGDDRVQNR